MVEIRGTSSGSPWSILPILSTCFLSSVLEIGPTLSMALLVTMVASGTSSSAPVERGNFQAPLGRYLPIDCGVALELRAMTKRPWEFPELEEVWLESGGWSFFQQLCIFRVLSTGLVSLCRLLCFPGWVSWHLLAQTGRCCYSVCPILRPCWPSSPQVSSTARRMGLL